MAGDDGSAVTTGTEDLLSAGIDSTYMLKVYELTEGHYEMDLQLFSVRMSLFLLVQTGLVAAVSGSVLKAEPFKYDGAIAIFGAVLAFAWLLVAVSSYCWISMWRWHLCNFGKLINNEINEKRRKGKPKEVFFFTLLHDPKCLRKEGPSEGFLKLTKWFYSRVRPTVITCCLPFLFITGWIYIGVLNSWSGI